MPLSSVMPHECSAWTSVTLMPSTSSVPPWLPAMMLSPSIPFEASHAPVSWFVTILGFVLRAISSASWMWSKWPCVMSITSRLSIVFSFSGAAGLFMTQGSIRISFCLALRTFHVPWPIQVKLTSALSGIFSLPSLDSEKPILPQAQNENRDSGHGPEVRENELARLLVEAQHEHCEQPEHAVT